MEEFYYEETNTKHAFLKCLIYLFIIGIAIGIFLFHKRENTMKLKKITVEVGSELSTNVLDYLSNGEKLANNYKLYINDVDINKVGEYTYKIKYNKHTKTSTIKVVDTTKPSVVLEDIIIGINEEFEPNILLESCEDYSLPCNVEFKDEKDLELLSTIGTKKIDFNITDAEGNITVSSANITVSQTETLSSKMTNDLEYYSNSEEDDKIEPILFEVFEKAIFEDTLEFEGIIQEVSALDFSEYVEKEIYSTKLITAYNQYGYVIGIQVEVTYVDGTKELITK